MKQRYCIVIDNLPILPIDKRLDPDVMWREFRGKGIELGHAFQRHHCTERKILRYILREYEDKMDVLKNSVLEISTQMEPCLYCYLMLSEIKKIDYFKEIYVFYPEMAREITLNIKEIEKFDEDFKEILRKEEEKMASEQEKFAKTNKL